MKNNPILVQFMFGAIVILSGCTNGTDPISETNNILTGTYIASGAVGIMMTTDPTIDLLALGNDFEVTLSEDETMSGIFLAVDPDGEGTHVFDLGGKWEIKQGVVQLSPDDVDSFLHDMVFEIENGALFGELTKDDPLTIRLVRQ